MLHTTPIHLATSTAHNLPAFPPLEQITKPNLTTEEAAFYCDRAAQTMRMWACKQPSGMQCGLSGTEKAGGRRAG